jgi:hypothetical protein
LAANLFGAQQDDHHMPAEMTCSQAAGRFVKGVSQPRRKLAIDPGLRHTRA